MAEELETRGVKMIEKHFTASKTQEQLALKKNRPKILKNKDFCYQKLWQAPVTQCMHLLLVASSTKIPFGARSGCRSSPRALLVKDWDVSGITSFFSSLSSRCSSPREKRKSEKIERNE